MTGVLDRSARVTGAAVLTCGLLGTGVGVAGLVARAIRLVPRVHIATLTWGAIVAVFGLALLTEGSMRLPRPTELWTGLKTQPGQGVLNLLAWTAAFAVEARSEWWWKDGVAAAIAVVVIGSAMVVLRPVPARTVTSAILAALLVTYLASAVFKREQYPFAPFQMYSVSQLDPREVIRYRLIATTAGGREIDITSVLGGATAAKLVTNPDDTAVIEALTLAARAHEERRGSNLESVRLVAETWQVVPYPGEATVRPVAVEERMQVDV